jgi:hypothetical protein
MVDNDFTPIRPVENLPNIVGLTPTRQRQERKRRPNTPGRNQRPDKTAPERAQEEQTPEQDDDPHTIDYRA